jgi:hypothetical protein
MKFQAIFRLPSLAIMMLATTMIAFAGCGGGGGGGGSSMLANCAGYGGGGSGGTGQTQCGPHPVSTASAAAVGLLLTGESAATTVSDGTVLGFFNGRVGNAPNGSGVVNLTANTNVQFDNIESGVGALAHTASFLGAYTGSYPATFTNTNGTTASPAGTVISTPNFSAGNINPGTASRIYNSGGPGMYVFGCFYHFVSNGMRTVIIVT